MAIQVIFETHSISADNELGIASGWRHSTLSERGRNLARALGERRCNDGISVVLASDLGRAAETARVAFEGTAIPILLDWRLRECDYGDKNGMPVTELHQDRQRYLDEAYPHGESWRQAVQRVGRFLGDIDLRWKDKRVLVIGHAATRWALDHFIKGVRLEDLVVADFAWQEGWEYNLA